MTTNNKYALISVYDKQNIIELAQFLLNQGYHIISTGGTYDTIAKSLNKEQYNKLIQVSDFTGFPEILDGRVKTLHPKIYGSILAKRDNLKHISTLSDMNIPLIDIVVCNLYPFDTKVTRNTPLEEAQELIDIGGVTLIRSSAKNFQHVLILTNPADYQYVIDNFQNVDTHDRKIYATKAFKYTSRYDLDIFRYFDRPMVFAQDEIKKSDKLRKKSDELNSNQNSDELKKNSELIQIYEKKLDLKYGCNPHQKNSHIYMTIPNQLKPDFPMQILNGTAGYINILDALNGWQLVKEIKNSLNLPAVASFKHTSPAGVAVYRNEPSFVSDLSRIANAFVRARNCDPMSSFGDFIALSDECDLTTALMIKREVSDGIIAPSYTPEALATLKEKKGNNYLIISIDPKYQPETPKIEMRDIFGLTISQDRNDAIVDMNVFKEQNIPTKNKLIEDQYQQDLLLANITLKYAQSNNVVMAKDGQITGVAAGQQSRVDAVKLAGNKTKKWYLRQHPKIELLQKLFIPSIKRQDKTNAIIRYVEGDFTESEFIEWNKLFVSTPPSLTEQEKTEFLLTLCNVSMASDAFFPFRDNIDHASKYGVKYIIQPGGSMADKGVIEACDQYGMIMTMTGVRMFTH